MSKVRPVILHLQDGTTIEYGSMAILAGSLGVHVKNLRECVKTGLYLDHNWMRVKVTYKDGLGVGSSVGDGIQALRKSKNNKSRPRRIVNNKPVIAILPSGERRKYQSIKRCADDLGVSAATVRDRLIAKRPTKQGIMFERA